MKKQCWRCGGTLTINEKTGRYWCENCLHSKDKKHPLNSCPKCGLFNYACKCVSEEKRE